MSLPKYSILPASSTDLPTLVSFNYASKTRLTINRLLWRDWPNEEAQKSVYHKAIQSTLDSPSAESFKLVDAESGELLGYVVLTRKQAGKAERMGSVSEALDPRVTAAVSDAVAEIAKEVEDTERFELTWIYVKSSSRRHGIGSELVRLCFERAKAAGLPIAVGAEPEAHDFFATLGFKDTRHVDFDLSEWAPPNSGFGIFRLAGMIWSP